MHKLYEAKELVEKEIGQVVAQGCVKPDQWDNLGKAIDVYKDIVTIESMQNYDNNEYSQARPYMSRDPWNANSYDVDRIDSRGSRMGSMNSYENYSRGNDNYHAIRMMENELDHTSDPKKREYLMETINILKNER